LNLFRTYDQNLIFIEVKTYILKVLCPIIASAFTTEFSLCFTLSRTTVYAKFGTRRIYMKWKSFVALFPEVYNSSVFAIAS